MSLNEYMLENLVEVGQLV